jgi:dephospho-CoA kinase
MLVVGLTGGVASGKTTVSEIWREEGAYIIDADQIARELVQPHTPAWNELKKVFGEEIFEKDGTLHRKKLGALVFSNPQKKNILNQILHPRIKKEMERRLKEIGQRDPEAIVVIDAALLIETGDYREMDKVIITTSTKRQQIERLRKRNGINPEEARRILSSQMTFEEKLKVADFVIRNEGSLEEIRRMAKKIFQELKRIALQKRDQLKSQQCD